MWGYSALACLQLALAVAAVPREGTKKLYVCQSGQCVVSSRGLPLAECEAACKPLPGQSVEITLLNSSVFVARSRVVKADNAASNGYVPSPLLHAACP
jgi:hypothetical protein